MSITLINADTFPQQAFPDLDLGDLRLNRRFDQVVRSALQHPQEPLPDKFHDPAGYQGCLRLLHHPAVSHQTLLSCHQVAVLDRLERDGPAVVLLLHDTTDLDFSNHKTLAPHLGQIGNGGGQGFLCHNSLAVDPTSREVFGLVSQLLHCRPRVGRNESVAAKRERDDRESLLWLRAIEEIGPSPATKLWVDVADRGADVFEFLQALGDRKRSFVIRSSSNRALVLTDEADEAAVPATAEGAGPRPHLLHDHLRTLPAQATWGVDVAATKQRPARTALVRASACPVTLKPPHVRKGRYRKEPVAVWAIRVWEPSPPEGQEPLEWLLLTDQAIPEAATLRRVVGWYECRPLVEEFHKGQKTGVGIEKLQLQDAESVRAAIALLSVVAVAFLNLRLAARDEEKAGQPARGFVPKLWVKVLSVWRYKEERELTVREFTLALGRLGGHLNRKSDGLPGWLTLWRGWERLHTMLEYEMSRATCDKH